MTIDEEALLAAVERQWGTMDMEPREIAFTRSIIKAYEFAKHSNLLALLESPKVVELVAEVIEDIEFPAYRGKETVDCKTASKMAHAALAAITSFIKGDGSATVAPVAGETDYSTSLTPTSYAGGQPERLEPSPSGAVVSSPDRQGEALIAEPPAPDTTDTEGGAA